MIFLHFPNLESSIRSEDKDWKITTTSWRHLWETIFLFIICLWLSSVCELFLCSSQSGELPVAIFGQLFFFVVAPYLFVSLISYVGYLGVSSPSKKMTHDFLCAFMFPFYFRVCFFPFFLFFIPLFSSCSWFPCFLCGRMLIWIH